MQYSNKNDRRGRSFLLFLLLVDGVFFGDRVVLPFLMLFTGVLLVLVVVGRVVHVVFAHAVFVALRYHPYESFL